MDFIMNMIAANPVAQVFMNYLTMIINYPEELPGYFAWLWKQAAEQGLSHEDVQLALKQLADWVSLCEKNTPKGLFRDWK
jgi:hypothetical protein